MGAADSAIAFARAQVGKPYQWGATGPSSFDCSGLVQAAFQAAGINLPRTTYDQVNVGTPVGQADLAPGDLVFPDPGHVQIYLGNGYVIEAPHTGANVRIIKMWGFWQGRRVTAPGTVINPADLQNAGGFGPPIPSPSQVFSLSQPHMRAILGGLLLFGGAVVAGVGVVILAAYGLRASGAERALRDAARPVTGTARFVRRGLPHRRNPETEPPHPAEAIPEGE